VKRVTFRVDYPPALTHPLHRRLGRTPGVSRMELLVWGPTDDVTALSWFDADADTVRALFGAVETVTAVDLVEDDAGTYAFTRQTDYEFADALLEVVGDAEAAFLPPVTFLDAGEARFEAAGRPAALGEFHDRLRDLVDVRIARVREFRREAAAADLTARQRAALSAGVAVGYYDVPRTGSVDDVAAELDCARSTAAEHLRKAESAVVADHVRRRSG
jgi:hypothetical protein